MSLGQREWKKTTGRGKGKGDAQVVKKKGRIWGKKSCRLAKCDDAKPGAGSMKDLQRKIKRFWQKI